jgi:cytochrome c peroxidase
MTKRRAGALLAGACALAAIFTCVVSAEDSQQALLERTRQLFKPLPADASTPERPITPERVALGKALFFEPRVSNDGVVSCAKCHQPTLEGTEEAA